MLYLNLLSRRLLNPWLSDVLHEHWTRLRAAERKWRKSNDLSDWSMYQSLLSSFSAEVHTAKSSHFHNKINSTPDMRNLFRTFNYLLYPPSPPPTTYITADDLQLFLQKKLKQLALFHCMVRHGTVRYGSLLGFFPLGTVPGT